MGATSTLSRNDIDKLFHNLAHELKSQGKIVDIAVYGGSALVLSFDFRESTGDVDAVWAGIDSESFRKATRKIADIHGLREDWINDGVAICISKNEKFQEVRAYPDAKQQYLRVFTAAPEYILAMKIAAMRDPWVSIHDDRPDIENILVHLKMDDRQDILDLVHKFYPDPLPVRNLAVLDKDILPNVRARVAQQKSTPHQ